MADEEVGEFREEELPEKGKKADSETQERIDLGPEENRRLAEAALFISGRGLTVKELLKAVPVLTPARARNALESLCSGKNEGGALEVVREVGAEIKYKMKVKDPYLSRVRRLSNFTDLSDGETKTLAVIAFYQPIKQSEIVKIRGNRAYEQVKNLIGAGLVVAEPKGITRVLKTTERFSDYFGAPLESLRDKLDSRDKAIIDGAVEAARIEVSAEERVGALPENSEKKSVPEEGGADEAENEKTGEEEGDPNVGEDSPEELVAASGGEENPK